MSIKQKLFTIFIVALLGFTAVFLVNYFGTQTINRALQASLNAQQAKIFMLEARRSEKDFLSKKALDLLEKNDIAVSSAMQTLSAVAQDQPDLSSASNGAKTLLQSYRDRFRTAATDVQVMGRNENEGLSGKLRTAIHQAESIFSAAGDDALMAGMLMLRRREKDFMLRGDPSYLASFEKDTAALRQKIAASEKYPQDRKELLTGLLETYRSAFAEYGKGAAALEKTMGELQETSRTLEPLLDELAVQAANELQQVRNQVAFMMDGAELGTVLLLAGLILWAIRSILNSLARLQNCSRRVASGQYEACEQERFTAELESLRKDISTMVATLRTSMEEAARQEAQAKTESAKAHDAMREAAREKDTAHNLLITMQDAARTAEGISRQLTESVAALVVQTTHVRDGAEDQKGQIQEVSIAMEEMNSTVTDVARNAAGAAAGAEQARAIAFEGGRRMGEVVAATGSAHQEALVMKRSLHALGTSVASIEQIMDLITDIADQTNLLALNAAIEAARAGETGRGFAVVADEVRKLAEKTMGATSDVNKAIRNIQQGTEDNMAAMDKASATIEKSTALADEAQHSLNAIVKIVSDTADQVRSIATASEEQSASSEGIVRSSERIRMIAETTTNEIGHAALAIEKLNALALDLKNIIANLHSS